VTPADDAPRPPAGDIRREQERYVRGLKYSAYDSVTSVVLGLASAIATARVFGVEVIGAFALATLLTGSLHMISNVREQGGLVRELTRYEPGSPEPPALLWSTLALSAAITVAVLIPFGALSVFLLSDVFDRPELVAPFFVLCGAYLAIDNTAFNFEAPLVAFRDGRSVWFARMAVTVTMIAGAVVCAIADERSIWALVTITIVAAAAGLLVKAVAVRRLIGLRSTRAEFRRVRPRLRVIVWFGVRQTPLNYTETAIEYADTAILGANVSLASVGAYSRAYTLYRRASQLPIALSRLYFPTLTALQARGESDAMLRVYRLSTRYLTLLLLPVATWLAACSPGVLDVFGPGFDEADGALSILAFGLVLFAVATTSSGLLMAHNRPGTVSIVSIGTAAVNVVLCLLLIGPLGLEGAALANAAGWFAECCVLLVIGARQSRRPLRDMVEGSFLARLVAGCAVAGGCLVAMRGLPVELLWQALAAVPVFAAGLLVFRPLPRDGAPSVEQVLASAGLRSARLQRAAARVHDAISHGGRGVPARAQTP
jgi:O-antigen/teichoic acid export membrane protein